MRYYLKNSDDLITGDFYKEGSSYFLEFEGNRDEVFLKKIGNQLYYSLNQLTWKQLILNKESAHFIFKNEYLSVHRGFLPSGGSDDGFGTLVTQMPGKVVKVLIKPGQAVLKGETLLILEAMKMENEIKSGIDAIVKTVHVKAGDSIDTGHLMVELETQD